MHQKDELHHLIHGLSGSEKRYFKQEAIKNNGGEVPNYLHFFEAYAKMETYDEATLKALPYIKYFSESKNHLLAKTLECIRNFEKKHFQTLRLKEMIADIQILISRGLPKQGIKYIKKAKAIAIDLDDQTSLLEILYQERKLYLSQTTPDHLEMISLLNLERTNSVKKLESLDHYIKLTDDLFMQASQQLSLQNKEDEEQLAKATPIHLLTVAESDLEGLALRFYYTAQGALNRLKQDAKNLLLYFKKLSAWWENHPKIAEERPSLFIIDVSNLILAAHFNQDYNLMRTTLEQLKNIKPKTFHDQQLHFSYSLNQIIYALETADLEAANTVLIGARRGINKYRIKGKRKAVLQINIALVHFFREEYESCSNALTDLTKGRIVEIRTDIRCLAHLIQMIVYYTLNQLGKLDALHRRTTELFRKLDLAEDSFEYQVLERVKNLQYFLPHEQASAFETFADQLSAITDNPNSKTPLGLDEINIWIQSKVQKKPLRTTYKIAKQA